MASDGHGHSGDRSKLLKRLRLPHFFRSALKVSSKQALELLEFAPLDNLVRENLCQLLLQQD